MPPAERTAVASEARRLADAAVVRSLDDRNPSVAARAALALGRSKQPAAVEPLLAHASSHDPTVRAAVAFALGLVPAGSALDRERRSARSDSASSVRYAAVDAIGRIVDGGKAPASAALAGDLLAVLRGDRDALVRAHTATVLDVFRDASNADAIAAGLTDAVEKDGEDVVRWHAMWAIFRGYATRVPHAFLASALKDPVELVRVEAARAWGRRSDPDAAAILTAALDDPSWHVQYQAREALRRLAKAEPTAHLTEIPPGIHVPALSATQASAPEPRPSPLAVGAPALEELLAPKPLVLPDARALDGPMRGPHPRALLRTTKGDVVVRLYPEWAPVTVANFLKLAARGYYDNNRWFRIVPDFVVQSGDPNDNGEGDAGYSIPAEENPIEQDGGVISMGLNYANGVPLRDSAGSQFYITLSPQYHLDRAFTVFGRVVAGLDVLAHLIESDRIIAVERIADG